MHLNTVTKALYALTIFGIADASYLTIAKYDGSVLFCSTSGLINCASVINSQYSTILGVPTSILGAVLFVLVPFMIIKGNDTSRFLWSIAGAGAVLYSVGAMALLEEVCEYCLLLDLFIASVLALSYYRTNHNPHRDSNKS